MSKSNDFATSHPPAQSVIQIVAFEIEYQATYISWKVVRSLDQLTNLHSNIQNRIFAANLPPLPTKSDFACINSPGIKEKLEEIIENLLDYMNQIQELWSVDFFREFISDNDSLLKLFIMHDKTLHYCMKLQKENEQLKVEVKKANETLRNIQPNTNTNTNTTVLGTSTTTTSVTGTITLTSPKSISSSISSSSLVSNNNNNNNNNNTIVLDVNSNPLLPIDNISSEKSFNTWSTPVIKTDNYLRGNIIPDYKEPTLLDKKIRNIIHLMCPSFETIYEQGLVYTYVANLIKKALGATCYESGAYSIRMNLPTEPIQITPFLCQGQEKNWYMKVNEILSNNSNNSEARITDIQFISTNNVNIVKCVVKNFPLEIISNNYSDLCFHTFIEEIDENMRRNSLLKLTIVFIKSFCIYDYYKHCHINILSYITDYGLYALILHIFYVYGDYINSPLQAFFYFIFEYQNLDWMNSVVTLDRIESLNSYMNNSNRVLGSSTSSYEIKDNKLFPSSVIVNYIELYNKPNQRKKNDDIIINSPSTSLFPSPSSSSSISISSTSSSSTFINQSINIENPLSPNHNLILQPIKDFKEDVLPGLFTFAQDKINHLLQLYINQNNDNAEIENKGIEELFEESLLKAGISSSAFDPVSIETNYFMSNTQNSLVMDIKVLYDRLEHSAYLLENEVTENALLSLTIDILKDKGPSPVGEIGKYLQDCLSCDNLSQILREQYGGLKKFLEKYQDIFVITKNHPYNPHVFLTEQLNDDCYKHLLNIINNPTSVKGKKNKKINNGSINSNNIISGNSFSEKIKNRRMMRDSFSSGGSSDNNNSGYDIGLIPPSYNDSYISYSLPNYNTNSFGNNNVNNNNISYSFDPSYYSISPPGFSNTLPQQTSSSSTSSQHQPQIQPQIQQNSSPTQLQQPIGVSPTQYLNTSPNQYQCNYNRNDYYMPSSFC